jgi:MAE_28990/MAE_18760-like HEPN
MFLQPLDGAKRALSALKSSLQFNLSLRAQIASGALTFPANFSSHPPHDEWKKLDHAVALSRLYLIYESLVHECVAEWLESLSNLVPYSALPEKVRSTHRDGIGFILQNLEGRRFSTLSVPTLIREYQEALSASETYKLHADAFLLHDRNLRLDELHKLVASCGLELNLADWLKNHRLVGKHESFPIIGHSSVEKAISSLVDLRNEASHATRQVGEILSEDVLIAHTDFVLSLIDALVEGFTIAALKWHVDYGAWSNVGRITLVVNSDKNVCVAPLSSCKIRVGMSIYIRGKSHCYRAVIEEIHLDDVSIQELTVAQPQEVGLRLDIPAIKSSDIFVRATRETGRVTQNTHESAVEDDENIEEVVLTEDPDEN